MNLDMFWLKDRSLEESEDLPEPDVLAQEIALLLSFVSRHPELIR